MPKPHKASSFDVSSVSKEDNHGRKSSVTKHRCRSTTHRDTTDEKQSKEIMVAREAAMKVRSGEERGDDALRIFTGHGTNFS